MLDEIQLQDKGQKALFYWEERNNPKKKRQKDKGAKKKA